MQYIGNNWFRFASVIEVFSAARNALGDCASLRVRGKYWDGSIRHGFDAATRADTAVLSRLRVEAYSPVPFGWQEVERMGDARVTPVLVRPVLAARGLMTPRMFETAAASTIPVYRQPDCYVSDLYNDDGELCLGDNPDAKLKEIVQDRTDFRASANDVRQRLYNEYSYPSMFPPPEGPARLKEVSVRP